MNLGCAAVGDTEDSSLVDTVDVRVRPGRLRIEGGIGSDGIDAWGLIEPPASGGEQIADAAIAGSIDYVLRILWSKDESAGPADTRRRHARRYRDSFIAREQEPERSSA